MTQSKKGKKQTKKPQQQSKTKGMKIMKNLFAENAEHHHTLFLAEDHVDFRDGFLTSVFYMLVLGELSRQHRERGNMTVMQKKEIMNNED